MIRLIKQNLGESTLRNSKKCTQSNYELLNVQYQNTSATEIEPFLLEGIREIVCQWIKFLFRIGDWTLLLGLAFRKRFFTIDIIIIILADRKSILSKRRGPSVHDITTVTSQQCVQTKGSSVEFEG